MAAANERSNRDDTIHAHATAQKIPIYVGAVEPETVQLVNRRLNPHQSNLRSTVPADRPNNCFGQHLGDPTLRTLLGLPSPTPCGTFGDRDGIHGQSHNNRSATAQERRRLCRPGIRGGSDVSVGCRRLLVGLCVLLRRGVSNRPSALHGLGATCATTGQHCAWSLDGVELMALPCWRRFCRFGRSTSITTTC